MNCITVAVLLTSLNGFALQSTEDGWELELVQLVFRNGHSAPSESYPNDPNDPKIWQDGLDELTMIGKKQLYSIGKFLKERYNNFLTDNPHELVVRSTFQSKCISSALCLLASLFVPTQSWMFKDGLKWQPIPVDYQMPQRDEILGFLRNCPAVRKELELIESLPSVKTVIEMFQQQLEFWTENSGKEIKNWQQAASLYYILDTQRNSNLTLPKWAKVFWEDLQGLNDLYYKMTFTNPNILKVVGGPLLWRMRDNAIHKTEGFMEKIKIIIYSGKSEHVAGVLGALNLLTREPPFSSMVIFELYKRNTTTLAYAVKLFQLNATNTDAQVGSLIPLVISGCSEMCPLDYFDDEVMKWRSRKRWMNLCKFG